MIVDEIDVEYVAFFKPKYDPPIMADRDAPEAFQIATEAMQPEALHVHVVDRSSHVKASQDTDDSVNEIWVQFASVVVLEKALEPTMPNTPDHAALVA